MDEVQMIKTITVGPLQQAYRALIAFLPTLAGALALLVAGWLVALILRKITGKMLRAFGVDVIAERTGFTEIMTRGGIRRRPSELLGTGVYWLILFSALVATFNALGLEIASLLLRAIVLYIPSILVALLLLGLGFVASRYIDTIVTATAAALTLPIPDVWGRAAQMLILFLAGVMALSELGIATTVVNLGFAVLLAVVGSAAVVAFGLGAKDVVAQFAAGQSLRAVLEVGDTIQYDGAQGTVQHVGPTHTRLLTPQGAVFIPNSVLLQATIIKPETAPVSPPSAASSPPSA